MKKTVASVLAVAIMAFALVSISEAASGNENWSVWAGFAPNHGSNAGTSFNGNQALFAGHVPNDCSRVVARDAERGERNLRSDISAPAYTDYTDARIIPTGEKRTPAVMGSW